MGRTLPTATQTLEIEKESWVHFRRTLRKEDQAVFDALWRWARRHTAPMSMASRAIPFEAVLMAMMLEIARRLPPEEPHGADLLDPNSPEALHGADLPGMDLDSPEALHGKDLPGLDI